MHISSATTSTAVSTKWLLVSVTEANPWLFQCLI